MNTPGTIRVLIADDNAELCSLLKSSLDAEENIEVAATAHDGHDALEKIARFSPDVAVLVCHMPGLDGLDILEDVRARTRRPVCIMISGNHHEPVIQRAMALGAHYFMFKPLDPKALAGRIRMFGGGREQKRGGGCHRPYADKKSEKPALKERISEILHLIGFSAHMRGYYYLRTAILKCVEDGMCISSLNKILYPYISKKYHTTPSCVEHSIRSAIDEAWRHSCTAAIESLLGRKAHFRKDKPSNAELIALISDTLRVTDS